VKSRAGAFVAVKFCLELWRGTIKTEYGPKRTGKITLFLQKVAKPNDAGRGPNPKPSCEQTTKRDQNAGAGKNAALALLYHTEMVKPGGWEGSARRRQSSPEVVPTKAKAHSRGEMARKEPGSQWRASRHKRQLTTMLRREGIERDARPCATCASRNLE